MITYLELLKRPDDHKSAEAFLQPRCCLERVETQGKIDKDCNFSVGEEHHGRIVLIQKEP